MAVGTDYSTHSPSDGSAAHGQGGSRGGSVATYSSNRGGRGGLAGRVSQTTEDSNRPHASSSRGGRGGLAASSTTRGGRRGGSLSFSGLGGRGGLAASPTTRGGRGGSLAGRISRTSGDESPTFERSGSRSRSPSPTVGDSKGETAPTHTRNNPCVGVAVLTAVVLTAGVLARAYLGQN